MKRPARLLTTREVADRLAISHRTIWRYVKNGMIPPPVKLQRCVRWREDQLDEFIWNLSGQLLPVPQKEDAPDKEGPKQRQQNVEQPGHESAGSSPEGAQESPDVGTESGLKGRSSAPGKKS